VKNIFFMETLLLYVYLHLSQRAKSIKNETQIHDETGRDQESIITTDANLKDAKGVTFYQN
jgi:hypothetical protein